MLPSELQMYLQWEMPLVPELPPSMSTAFIPHLNCIAGNFRGRYKLVENEIFAEKTSWIATGVAAKRHHAPSFAEKAFVNGYKASKFAKVFSL